jgi:hypothetical protein
MPRGRKSEPTVLPKRTFVIKLDRSAIVFLLSILGLLGVGGVEHLLSLGAVDEVRVGSTLQVNDSWSRTRDQIVKLTAVVKDLGEKVEALRADNENLKSTLNRIQQQRGFRPLFSVKSEPAATPEIQVDALPEAIPYPSKEQIQEAMKNPEPDFGKAAVLAAPPGKI